MGELADEVQAKLEVTWATSELGMYVMEHGGLPPRAELLIEETFALLLESQRALGEVLIHIAREIDELRGT